MANATALIPFSASTQGKSIKVVATATAGTTIHTTGVSSTVIDRLYVFAYNDHTADVLLTLEWGGVTVPDNIKRVTIPFKSGDVLIADGLPLLGSGSVGLTVAAFAGTANVIIISGWVMRVTP